jgi:hypothetical protein
MVPIMAPVSLDWANRIGEKTSNERVRTISDFAFTLFLLSPNKTMRKETPSLSSTPGL